MFRDELDLDEEEEDLLHGKCNIFVNKIFKPGDTIIALVEMDYDLERPALLHSFILRNNKYIDVRGSTNNIDDILDSFDYGDFQEFQFSSLSEFNKFLQDLEKGLVEVDLDY